MSNYELYEKVIEASKGTDEGTFVAAARNWVEGAEDAPFEGEDARELFSSAKMYCAAWRNKAINGRVSKGRMVSQIRKLAEMGLPNPYKKEYSVVDDLVKEEKKEQKHVLGVLPDIHAGFEKFDGKEEPKEEVSEKAPDTEEEKPHFFGKRNKK